MLFLTIPRDKLYFGEVMEFLSYIKVSPSATTYARNGISVQYTMLAWLKS